MDARTDARREKIVRFVDVVFVRLSSGITRGVGKTTMGFSDAIYESLVRDWVKWVTVGKDGRCHGWECKPQYSQTLNRWIATDPRKGDSMTIPQKDASLEGLWERPAVVGKEFVLVDKGQVGAKLKKQFDAFLTDSGIELTPVQRKLSAVILQAAARDSQLMQLLTEPANGLSFVLKALDAFGACFDRQMVGIKHGQRSAPMPYPYLVGDNITQT